MPDPRDGPGDSDVMWVGSGVAEGGVVMLYISPVAEDA